MQYDYQKRRVATRTVLRGPWVCTIQRFEVPRSDKFGVVGAVMLSVSTTRDDNRYSSIAKQNSHNFSSV